MNTVLYPSGEWVGYYTYDARATKCPMHITLNFAHGRIKGAGIDNPGQFVIEGTYDDSNLQSKWIKQYIGKHSVQYQGAYRDGEIIGLWCLTHSSPGRTGPLHGEFRIWPLPQGKYRDDEPLQSILEREIRRKT